jgi:hypothetical protein
MMVVITSLAPDLAFITPGIAPQIPPAIPPMTRHRGI